MTNLQLYNEVSFDLNRHITKKYSSSFSRSIMFLEPEIREGIYNIYGFVRLADEIVDTFHDYPKKQMLDDLTDEYHKALKWGISINPVIHSFCFTKKKYSIPDHLVQSFLDSMYMDLEIMKNINQEKYENYIYGSAEVVGLMCLHVFLKEDMTKFNELKQAAKSLGSALQKVNFLRDFNADFQDLDRVYFPNIDFSNFTEKDKKAIEDDIAQDFKKALVGIKKLPLSSQFAVYLAYRYYYNLFEKIGAYSSKVLFKKRIRINNFKKFILFSKVYIYKKFQISIH
ncbi:squalene/phytoene synthase family protein [Weeksellaceae bacterium TAE3-ERU29]|nr:squalene/phytoene synthase family protein [Weeksellaceae bacterium TAE3-ERU29]